MTKRTRRGRRSGKAEQRRYLRRLISKEAYKDTKKAESVNTLTPSEIYVALHEKYDNVKIHRHLQIDRGTVLSDARGEGLLQQRSDEDEE